MKRNNLKKYILPATMLIVFETVAITLWLTKNNIFYLFNFSYIGISITLGLVLFAQNYKHARRVVQLLVGLYMLIYLGLICNENMQIEGFWYYLFTGVFEAATIHYAVAKIFGPLIFGRGWCGYACWTAMVLDFLPYKTPDHRRRKISWFRYVTFIIALVFVAVLFVANVANIEGVMFWAFIVGNALYYVVGITLAIAFKDNRAFCKYICPQGVLEGAIPLSIGNAAIRSALGKLFSFKCMILIAVIVLSILFYRPFCKWICPLGAIYSLFNKVSLLKITVDSSKCVGCGQCSKACKMDVDVCKTPDHPECIRCGACIKACPKDAICYRFMGKSCQKNDNR